MAEPFAPLRQAGFVSNPFRTLSDSEWADVVVVPPAVLHLIEHSAAHIQLVGSMGSGKTTTLHGLKAWSEDRRLRVVYESVDQGLTAFRSETTDLDLLLLDEAQRLSALERVRLLTALRNAGGGLPRLALATHQDLTSCFEYHGLPLATIHIDRLPAAEYRRMLDRRLEHSALPDRVQASLSDDAVSYLLETFGPDRRSAEWLLYEAFQELRAPLLVDAHRLRTVQARLSRPGGAS